MRVVVLLILLVICVIGCDDSNRGINDENIKIVALSWNQIKNKFPSSEIKKFDFDENGEPYFDFEKLQKLDSLELGELMGQVEFYENWREYHEVYFFSKNMINGVEIGVLLSVVDFDGRLYSFNSVIIDEKGKVKLFNLLAHSWRGAECAGHISAYLNYETGIIKKYNINKCYDNKAFSKFNIDSSFSESPLKSLIQNTPL